MKCQEASPGFLPGGEIPFQCDLSPGSVKILSPRTRAPDANATIASCNVVTPKTTLAVFLDEGVGAGLTTTPM